MKLNELHLAKALDFTLTEGYNSEQQEKLAHIRLMIAKQGKDPEPILNRIRGMIDPDFAKREGFKNTIKKWVETAKRGDERTGNAYGKKVKITVLESIMMTEGILDDLSGYLTKKLSKIIGNERQENKLVAKVLDKFPELTALQRYTQQVTKAGRSVYNDPKFWELVNRLTSGKGEQIKRTAHSIFKRLVEEAKLNQRGLLSECILLEASISDMIVSLGVPQEAAVDLLNKYGVKDDLGYREVSGLESTAQAQAQNQAQAQAQAQAQTQAQNQSTVQAAPVKKYDKYEIEEENNEFTDTVILLAASLAEAEQAGTPQKAAAAVQAVLKAPVPGSTEKLWFEPEAEVSADELMKSYSA